MGEEKKKKNQERVGIIGSLTLWACVGFGDREREREGNSGFYLLPSFVTVLFLRPLQVLPFLFLLHSLQIRFEFNCIHAPSVDWEWFSFHGVGLIEHSCGILQRRLSVGFLMHFMDWLGFRLEIGFSCESSFMSVLMVFNFDAL